MTRVYHHTTTRHLPWIVQDGELRPRDDDMWFGRNFVWASTVPGGDPTAACRRGEGLGPHRDLGCIKLIRFTFRASDFTPWAEIKRKYMRTKKHRAFAAEWQRRD
jgi:hypothetical protein